MIVSVGTSIKITLREREREGGGGRERQRQRQRERERVGGMRLTATKPEGGGLSCLITRWGSLQANQWPYNPEFMYNQIFTVFSNLRFDTSQQVGSGGQV